MRPEVSFDLEANNAYWRCRNMLDRSMRKAECVGTEKKETGETERKYTLSAEDCSLAVTVSDEENTPDVGRIRTRVENTGKTPVLLNSVASVYLRGIPVDGDWWRDKNRFSVFVCRNVWQGEGQWDERTLSQMGLYPVFTHPTLGTAKITSMGTWTSADTFPMVILCDKKENVCWCIEPEFSSGRYLEIGCEQDGDGNASLYVFVASAYEGIGWHRTLEPGQTYVTEPVAFGKVSGGFEQAVAAMTAYRRATSLVKHRNGVAPLCFNDYMNCLWAMPTREKLLPIISAAADAGCEVFCIDAGWFGGRNGFDKNLGEWVPNDELFDAGGLKGILDEISRRGMIPGLWLELEAVGADATYFKEHPEALLTRHGVKMTRDFADIRLPAVRKYLTEQIDALCAMGVGFFKNDYNGELRFGCDSLCGGTLADGAREYMEAFLSFIDETLARHPGLVIENCGSGAMRSDHGTLSHFALQSVSDQEHFFRLPSIVQGSLACMEPEKTGIWAYPYPLLFPNRHGDPKTDVRVDAEETKFNLATALFGCFYLSGHIELADAAGKALLKEAAQAYRNVREWTCRATAIYPCGMKYLDDTGAVVLGLRSEADGKILLGVFGVACDAPETVKIDLAPYGAVDKTVRLLFPSDTAVRWSVEGTTVTAELPAGMSSAVFVAE